MIEIAANLLGIACVLGLIYLGAFLERAGFFDWWHGE